MNRQPSLIEAIVRGVEDFLQQHQLSMTSGRKARLVQMLFVYFRDRTDTSSAGEVERLLDQYWLEVERALQREISMRSCASSLH